MTQFTDRYGRTWNHHPGHDTGKMLKIKPEIMLAAYNFQAVIRNQNAEFDGAHSNRWPVENPDCYLLQYLNNARQVRWYAGIRCSDEPSDYISPHFDDRVIDFMIEHHKYRCSMQEFDAMMALGVA